MKMSHFANVHIKADQFVEENESFHVKISLGEINVLPIKSTSNYFGHIGQDFLQHSHTRELQTV
jgi:hypothetical protein